MTEEGVGYYRVLLGCRCGGMRRVGLQVLKFFCQ